MIQIVVYLLFFLFSLGQIGRVSFFDSRINFYVFEPIIFSSTAYFIFKHGLTPFKNISCRFKPFLIFLSVMSISFLASSNDFSVSENIIAFLYLARLFTYPVFFVYLKYHFPGKKFASFLENGLYLFFFITAFFGVIQFFFYPDLRNLYYLGWDPHFNRLFGVFFDTGLSAAVYGIVTIFLYRKKMFLPAFFFLMFLIITFSRSAYLSFTCFGIYEAISKRKYAFFLIVFVMSLFVFFLVPKNFGVGVGLDRLFSVSSRIEDYKLAFEKYKKKPVLGYGYNRIGFIKESKKREAYPDHAGFSYSSSYLIILVAAGMVGLAAFLYLIKELFAKKVLSPYLVYAGILSLADNIILHPHILFLLGCIYFVSLSDS